MLKKRNIFIKIYSNIYTCTSERQEETIADIIIIIKIAAKIAGALINGS